MDGPPSAVDVTNSSGTLQLRRTPAAAGAMEPARWTLWTEDGSETADSKEINKQTSLVALVRQKTPPLIDTFIDRKEDAKKQDAELGFDRARNRLTS
jgi:hypothetical protein